MVTLIKKDENSTFSGILKNHLKSFMQLVCVSKLKQRKVKIIMLK